MRRILYAAPISFERKDEERDVYIDELLKRLQLTFGAYIANLGSSNLSAALPLGGAYGIVSTYDPSKAPLELSVIAEQNSASTVAVQPGMAVFPNGEIIVIDQALSLIPVASTAPGAVNVLYLQFAEQEVDPAYTHSNVLVNTRVVYLEDPSLYVTSTDITTWNAFTSVDLQTKIPLAVVGVDSSGQLSIDQSQAQLTTNRPWFSAVDIQHRSKLGTGVVTASNPHGTSLNDLSASNGKTILDLLTTAGVIIARDAAMTKVPGHVCQEVVPPGQVIQDTAGAVTGVQNAWYVQLTRYPQQLVRVTIQDTVVPANNEVPDLAGMLVPGRNIVVFADLDEQHFGLTKSTLIVEYVAVDALSPVDAGVITSAISFKPPWVTNPSDETIIAGGLSIGSPITQLSMTDAGPFPSLYRLFLRGDGFVYKTPQPVFCYMQLTAMGTAVQPTSISMLGPARLRVGLTQATAGPQLSVQVKLSGTDASNNAISEIVTFDSAWSQDITVGTSSESAILNSKIYQTTANTFAKLQSVQLVAPPQNAGSSAAIAVWAVLESTGTTNDTKMDTNFTGSGAASGLPLVDLVWDGSKVAMDPANLKPQLRDLRPVSLTVLPSTTSSRGDSLRSLFALPSGGSASATYWGLYEDFNAPRFVANRYVKENAAKHNPANAEELPRFSRTRMSRMREGLGRLDTYVSRPIAVKPYDASLAAPLPQWLRFVPVDRGVFNYKASGIEGFSLWARVYLSDGVGWSSWSNVTGFSSTNTLVDTGIDYRLDLQNVPYAGNTFVACSPINQLVKFQFVVQGPCRGMMILADYVGPVSLPPTWVYDVGIWDELYSGGDS